MKLSPLISALLATFFLICPKSGFSASAKPQSSFAIEQEFKTLAYTNYLLPPDYAYPRIFIQDFPQDFTTIKSPEQRHKFFLMLLLPLALQTNQDITKERLVADYLLHKYKQNQLDASDINLIEHLADKYDIFTRLSAPQKYELILNELQNKIDIIPPSILLATAAINTNWGEAYFLPLSNNLYRSLNWYSDDGLKPRDETQDDSYRIKIYPSLQSSMTDFALKLNSSIDYQEFRNARRNLRQRNQTLSGRFLSPYLIFASALPNFAGLLDYTITFYRLEDIDRYAHFTPNLPKDSQPSVNVTKN